MAERDIRDSNLLVTDLESPNNPHIKNSRHFHERSLRAEKRNELESFVGLFLT